MNEIVLKRFEKPDEIRRFEKGIFEVVHLGDRVLGRASYEPGWKWSDHVAGGTGEGLCEVDHLGLVLQGRVMVRMRDGTEIEMKAGDLFEVRGGHDSWVVGDEPYVSLHFMGADEYAS